MNLEHLALPEITEMCNNSNKKYLHVRDYIQEPTGTLNCQNWNNLNIKVILDNKPKHKNFIGYK